MAVGTLTVAASEAGRGITKYLCTWTSSAGGAVSANSFAVPSGYLVAIKCVPDSGGTQPDDLYDLTLVDADTVDVLDSRGLNLSNAAGKILQWDPPLFIDTATLDLVIANAGSAKGGTVSIWMLP